MEANTVIVVKNVINSDLAITTDDGNLLYDKIEQALSKKKVIELDFEGITIMITAFLNSAIGRLYEKYTSEDLNKYLKLKNVAPEDKQLFSKVVQRAQEYFRDKEGFENSVNEAL